MNALLSPGEVARRLGVATTTLRTWHQRYGLGPTGHQSGRHRRYTDGDLAALTAMARLTARGVPAALAAAQARRDTGPADHPTTDPGTRSAARGLARAARRLDVLALRETLTAAVAAHGVVHTYHTVVGPAFHHITEASDSATRKTVARRILAQSLSEVVAAVPRPPAGTPVRVVLLAAGGRRDVTALDALAAALAEQRIGAIHLGAGLPPEAVAETLRRSRPLIAVVWSHARHPDAPPLLAALTAVPHLVMAGQGWSADPGTTHCRTLADAVTVVAGLLGAGRHGSQPRSTPG